MSSKRYLAENQVKKLKTLLKIALSLLLLLFVLRQIDTHKLLAILQKSDIFWLFWGFIFFNISKIVSSVRLNYYFRILGIQLSQASALILYYVGMFYNLFLPGGIGGDGYKIYLLHKFYKTNIKHLIQATLLDRISGLVALIFLASLLFAASSFVKIWPPLLYIAILSAITIFPLYIVMYKRFFPLFLPILKSTTFLGVIVQILQLVSAYFLIVALPYQVNTIDFLTLFLISSVVAVLPLTIGGVGAREFTFLYGLKLLGSEPSLGVAFSFLFFLVTLLSSALGIFFIHKPLGVRHP